MPFSLRLFLSGLALMIWLAIMPEAGADDTALLPPAPAGSPIPVCVRAPFDTCGLVDAQGQWVARAEPRKHFVLMGEQWVIRSPLIPRPFSG